jgi:hypothetical protein
LQYGNFNAGAVILPFAKPRLFGKREAAHESNQRFRANAELFERFIQVHANV